MKKSLNIRVLGIVPALIGLLGISHDAGASITFTGQFNQSAHAFRFSDPSTASCASIHTQDGIGIGNSCPNSVYIDADIPYQFAPGPNNQTGNSFTYYFDGLNNSGAPATFC